MTFIFVLCFFIVLDLRFTKIGCRETTFFFAHFPRSSRMRKSFLALNKDFFIPVNRIRN